MKVIATELGFDSVTLRHPGDEFEMPDNVFDDGRKTWFEPADPKVKAEVEARRKAPKAPEVPAIDPAKQAAEHEASIRSLNEKHAATVAAMQDEIDALKKAKPQK
jgi:hypothetical protein